MRFPTAGRILLLLVLTTAWLGQTIRAGAPSGSDDVVVPVASKRQSKTQVAVAFKRNEGNLALFELSGNYDRNETDGSFNLEARAAVADAFYAQHADEFDFLVVFTTFEFNTGNAQAFYVSLFNDTQGIGQNLIDLRSQFQNSRKLQGYIDMAALTRYELDALQPDYDATLDTLLHETMHRWGVHAQYRDGAGNSSELLGYQASHWSQFVSSDASVMGGGRWRDNGDGHFTATDVRYGYNPADLYLAGFLPSEQVPDFFYLRNANGDPSAYWPKVGDETPGNRVNVSIAQIVQALGPRVPDHTTAQHDFRAAFLLLTRPGEEVSAQRLAELNDLTRAYGTRFSVLTRGVGIMRTFLAEAPALSIGHPHLISGGPALGGSANLQTGASWLLSQQQPDGSWGDKPLTRVVDTYHALTALEQLNSTDPGLERARTWLRQRTPQNHDERAWIIASGVLTGATATLVDELISHQNADGGWGLVPGLRSSAFDTALILQQLQASGLAPAAVLDKGAAWLIANRQLGWGPASGGAPAVDVTARALSALLAHGAAPTSLGDCFSWLTSRQNADGSFGQAQGSSHETALVLRALTLHPDGSGAIIDAAALALEGRQTADGSWDGSVYATAQAILALRGRQAPNLTLSPTLVLAPSAPRDGQIVQLGLRVNNTGLLATPATSLRLYDGDPANGGQALGPDLVVPALDSGAGVDLTTRFDSFGHAGTLRLTAWLDPDQQLAENNENDNLVSRDVAIAEPLATPEIDPLEHLLVFEPGVIATLPTDLHVLIPLRNPSTASITAAKLSLQWQVDEEPWQELDLAELDLAARTTVPVSFDVDLTRAGQVRLRLIADPDNAVAESDESNNTVAFEMGQQASLDLTVLASDLHLDTPTPTAGEDVAFTATLRNLGTKPSPQVRLQAWVDGPNGSTSILDQTLQMLPGEVSPRQLLYRAGVVGSHRLRVALDTGNVAAEASEANNQAQLDFEVFSTNTPNLAVDHAQMVFAPLPGLEGQPLTVSLPLTNTSNSAAGPFRVELYQGVPGNGGVLLGSQEFPAGLAGAGTAAIAITSPPLQGFGEKLFYLAVDPDNQVAEHREDDNSAFKVILVQSLPDLAVTPGSLDLSPALPIPGEPVLARITVDNLGQQPAADVAVELYEQDEHGDEQLIGTTVIANVAANGSATATLNWNFGPSTRNLRIVVDAGDLIQEGHEDNNQALAPTTVQDRHFFASQRYISPNGDSVQDTSDLIFSVDAPASLSIEIRDSYNRLVRSFSDGVLASQLRGAVVWDGRDDSGVLVRDGDFRARLQDADGALLGQLVLTVDTNRTPILDAAGTARAYFTDLRCSVRNATNAKFSADGKYLYAKDVTTLDGAAQRGLFRVPTRGQGLDTLVSRDWLVGVAKPLGVGEYIGQIFPLADGRIVFTTSFSPSCGNCDLGLWLLKSSSAPPVRLHTGPATQFFVREANTDYVILDGAVVVSLDPTVVGAPMQMPDNAYLNLAVAGGALAYAYEYGEFHGESTNITKYWYVSANPAVAPVYLGGGPEVEIFISDDRSHVALFAHTDFSDNEAGVRRKADEQYGEIHVWQVADTPEQLFSESFDLPAKWEYSLSWSPANQLLTLDGPRARIQLRDRNGLAQQTFALPTNLFQEYLRDIDLLAYRYGFDKWNDWAEFGEYEHPVRWDERGRSFVVGFNLYVQQFIQTPEKREGPLFNGIHAGQLYRIDLADGQPQLLGSVNRTGDPDLIFPRQLEDWNPNRLTWPARTEQLLHDSGMPRTLELLPAVANRDLQLGNLQSFWPGRAGIMTKKLLVANPPGSGDSECQDGSADFIYESTDNLLAHLEIGMQGLVLELKGVAADRNLASHQLDWAYAAAPNTWFTLSSPSTAAIVDDVLDTWVPPEPGAYLVRLTVRDKAGNVDQVVRNVQWFDQASLASVKAEPRYISPNGDSVQDATLLSFRVLEPIHLDVTIEDENGRIVRRLAADYPVVTGQTETLVWDGRNQVGNLVGDGIYLMRVQNRRFKLIVDNTPPLLRLTKPSPYGSEEIAPGDYAVQDHYTLTYRIEEPNLDTSLIDFQGPLGGRHEFAQIGGIFGETVYKLPTFTLEPQSFVEDPYRIAARDLAGNGALFDAAQLPPELIWRSVRQLQLVDGKQEIEEKRIDYQEKPFLAANAPRMTVFRHGDYLAFEAILTSPSPNTSYWIEYQDHGGNWVSLTAPDQGLEVPELLPFERNHPYRHLFYLAFDQILPGEQLMRLRANIDGQTVTSNLLRVLVEPALRIGNVAADYPKARDNELEPAEDNDLLLQLVAELEEIDPGKSYIWVRESVSGSPINPRIVVTSTDDARYVTPTQFTPLAEVVFAEPSEFSGTIYKVATLPCNTYEISFLAQIPRPDGPPRTIDTRNSGTLTLKRSCIEFKNITLEPIETLACAAQPSGKVKLGLTLFVDRGEVPTNLEVYAQVAGQEPVLIANRPRPRIGDHTFILDTTDLPEGQHSLRIEAVDTVGERTVTTELLYVDRTPAQATLDYPAEASQLCAELTADGSFYLPLEGVVRDDFPVAYDIYIGNGHDNPSLTLLKEGKAVAKSEQNVFFGELVNPDEHILLGLRSGEVTARIVARDWSGASACVDTHFWLDVSVDVSVPKNFGLLSPNGDGVFDSAEIPVIAYETLLTTVELWSASSGGGGNYYPGSFIDTLVDSQTIGGEWPFPFLGADAGGNLLPDGVYALRFTFEDPCGFVRHEFCYGEIDTTPPQLAIDYPHSGDPLGALVEVLGSFDDLHFATAEVAFAEADANPLWSRLERHQRPLPFSTMIAQWPLAGLSGNYLLRLSGRDAAANESELIVPIQVDQPTVLVWALNGNPRLFSPNGDGVLDTSQLGLGLSANALISATIQGAGQTVRRTLLGSQLLASGTHFIEWDGRDDGGNPLADGAYKLVVRAVDPTNSGFSQEESLTLTLDTAAPELTLTNPGQPIAKGQGRFTVQFNDLHPNDLRVTYSQDGGPSLTALEANAAGQHFGLDLADLAEGDYDLDALARDLAGNTTRIERPFTIDNTPPLARLDLPLAQAVLGGAKPLTEVRGAASDTHFASYRLERGAGDSWTLLVHSDQAPQTDLLHSWPVTAPDGPTNLRLTVTDQAGWQSEALTPVIVDTTAPTVAISQPANGALVARGHAVIGTANDANLVDYRLQISPNVGAPTWSDVHVATSSVTDGQLMSWTQTPPDGTYRLRLIATDKAGLVAETEIRVTLDTEPPLAALELAAQVQPNYDVALTWTASPSADVDHYQVFRNAIRIGESATTHYLDPGVSEGEHLYHVVAVDRVGNLSQPSNQARAIIDRTPPELTLIEPQADSKVRGLVPVVGTATSPDDFYEYRLFVRAESEAAPGDLLRRSGVAAVAERLSTWDSASAIEGAAYIFRLEAEDTHHNQAVVERRVLVDNLPPAAPAGLDAVVQNGDDARATWNPNSEPDLAGYLLYLDGQLANASGPVGDDLRPYLLAATSFLDLNLSDGVHTYIVHAVDSAGNISAPSAPKHLTIETGPPDLVFVQPVDGTRFDASLYLLTASDDRDHAQVLFQIAPAGTGAWTNLAADLDPPFESALDPVALGLAHGDYQLRATATDTQGLSDPTPAQLTVTFTDLQPPDAPLALTAQVDGYDVALAWQQSNAPDLAGYVVFRQQSDGSFSAVSPLITETSYDDNAPLGPNLYLVRAVDSFDNASADSNLAQALIFQPSLTQPFSPTQATRLTLSGQSPVAGTVAGQLISESGTSPIDPFSTDAEGHFALADLALELGRNHLELTVTDAAGNLSVPATLSIASGPRPQPPQNPTVAVNGYDTSFAWEAPPATSGPVELEPIGYRIYRDGQSVYSPQRIYPGTYQASSRASDGYRTNDDNLYTYWYPSDPDLYSGQGTYFEIEHEQALLQTVEVNFLWGYSPTRFAIQGWDGAAWIDFARFETQSDANTITLPQPFLTTRVRVLIEAFFPDNFRPVRLGEFHLHHLPFQAAPPYEETTSNGRFAYTATTLNGFGFESDPSPIASAEVGDVDPPQAVVLSGNVSGVDAYLEWTASPSPDLAGYALYRDNNLIASVNAGGDLNFADQNLANGTYTYQVVASDQAGNQSPSNLVTLTIQGELPPTPTLSLAVAPSGDALDLSWVPNGAQPTDYILSRAIIDGGPYQELTWTDGDQSSYRDQDVEDGVTYSYIVVARDSRGNLSQPSNQVSGRTLDTVPPADPVITFPVSAGQIHLTEAETSGIGGTAEPGATVEVRRNGQLMGRVLSPRDGEVIRHEFEDSFDTSAQLSPDGRYLLSSDSPCRLFDVQAGTSSLLPFSGAEMFWAADSQSFYAYHWSFNGQLRRYDLAGQHIDSFGDFDNIQVAAASPNGRQLLIGGSRYVPDQNTWRYTVWFFDRDNGDVYELANTESWNIYNRSITWSPDGNRVAFVYNDNTATVQVFDIATRQLRSFGSNVQDSALAWDKTSARLYFAQWSNNTLYSLDIASEELTELAVNVDRVIGTSPDNDLVAYRQECCAAIILDLATGQTSEPIYHDDTMEGATWTASGHIFSVSWQAVQEAILPGYFWLPDMPLLVGDNLVSATAEDQAGNRSRAADPITIRVSGAGLPDMAILAGDLTALPAAGLPGTRFRANLQVRNLGQGDAPASQLVLLLTAPDGSGRQLLPQTTLAPLAAGATLNFSVDLNGETQLGTYRLTALVDGQNALRETDETNNLQQTSFRLFENLQPALSLRLDRVELPSGQNATGQLELFNPGPTFHGRLVLTVADPYGFPVATVLDLPVQNLAFGAALTFPIDWDTTAVYAGAYQFQAELSDSQGHAVDHAFADFSLGGYANFGLTLTLDHSNYQPDQPIVPQLDLRYLAGNTAVDDAVLHWSVIAPDDSVVQAFEGGLPSMLPGFTTGRTQSFDLADQDPGDYRILVELVHGLGSASADILFTLDPPAPVLSLTGTLATGPRQIPLGSPFSASYTVVNRGGVYLDSVPLTLALHRSGSLEQVASASAVTTLASGQQQTFQASFQTTALGFQSYLLVLTADLSAVGGSPALVLDTRSIATIDATAPEVEGRAPLAGAVVGAAVTVRAFARDLHSPIASVAMRLDSGLEQQMGLTGTPNLYRRDLTGLAEGEHLLAFSAADTWSNRTETSAYRFTVDLTPPLIQITGVTDGAVTNHSVTPVIDVAEAHPGSLQIRLNGQPFVSGTPVASEGPYALSVVAVDAAGNRAEAALGFTLDLTPPLVQVSYPSAGAVLTTQHTAVTGTTEAAVLVTLVAGAYSETVAADATGAFAFAAVPLLPGQNLLRVHAVDRAGNVGPTEDVPVTLEAPSPAVSGSLGLPAAPLAIGTALAAGYSLHNTGNIPLSGRSMRINAYDIHGNLLLSQETSFDLQPNQTISGALNFATAAWLPGSHRIDLQAQLEDSAAWIDLDSGLVQLEDRTPPSLALLSPADGALLPASFAVEAQADDQHSQPVAVSYLLDGQVAPLVLVDGANHRYAAGASDQTDGIHQLALRAADGVGNMATTAAITVEVDATPPLITVDGLADGGLYNHPVSPVVTLADAHPDQQTITLDGAPYSSGLPINREGQHLLAIQAVDQVGNTSARSLSFSLDLTPPQVVIHSPANGATLSVPRVDIVGTTEPGAQVALSGTGLARQTQADAGGAFRFDGVTLSSGANSFALVATDRADNTGPSSNLTVNLALEPPVVTWLEPAPGPVAASFTAAVTAISPSASAITAVQLTVDGVAFTAMSADPDQPGRYLATVIALSPGQHLLRVLASDADGSQGQSGDLSVTVPGGNLELVVTTPSQGATLDQPTTTVAGTTSPGALLTLTNGAFTAQVLSSDGHFSFAAVPIAPGLNTLIVAASLAGQHTEFTVQVTGACHLCDAGEILVDEDVIIDFNSTPPVYLGEPDLAPFFSYAKHGAVPHNWRAQFHLGQRSLRVAEGVRITVRGVAYDRGSAVPGLLIADFCSLTIEESASIDLLGSNAATGSLVLDGRGDIHIAGLLANRIEGTWGVTGELRLLSRCGDIAVAATGKVLVDGTQEGARDLNLSALGGDIHIAGLVDAVFGWNRAPNLLIAAYQGAIVIDGGNLLGLDPVGSRPVASGVSLRCRAGRRPGNLDLIAGTDITVHGYGYDPRLDQNSATFTLDLALRSDGNNLPVTVTLSNSAAGEVRVDLRATGGHVDAFFANLFDHALLPQLTASGADLNGKFSFVANAVDGLPNQWMAPPGGWDMGIGFKPSDSDRVSFTLRAPGLTWQQLMATQRDGFCIGVLGQASGKRATAERMGMRSPLFDRTRQYGTVAVKSKQFQGSSLSLRALGGAILAEDFAIDNANKDNAAATNLLQACGGIQLATRGGLGAHIDGDRVVVTVAGTAAGGRNTLRASDGTIEIAEAAQLLAPGSPAGSNLLQSCDGVFVDGQVAPADLVPGDDSGVCDPGTTPSFSSTPITTTQAGRAYSYSPQALDAALLTLVQAPVGMTLENGRLSWTPDPGQLGSHQVELAAIGTCGLVTQRFTLTVTTAKGGAQ